MRIPLIPRGTLKSVHILDSNEFWSAPADRAYHHIPLEGQTLAGYQDVDDGTNPEVLLAPIAH